MEKSQSQFARSFKGIWIPKEIWLDKRLSYFEKCLLSEIHSLDDEEKGCFASNQYFMEFFNERERKIQTGLSKLKSLGYITYEKFDGRIRTLRSNICGDKSLFNTSGMSKSTPLTCQNPHPSLIGEPIETDNKAYNIDIKETPPIPPKGGSASGDAEVCAFGKFVKFSKKEFEELSKIYGEHIVRGLIDEINDYLASTGKKPYKDYAAVVRQWARRRSLTPATHNHEPILDSSTAKEIPRAFTPAEKDYNWLESVRKGNKQILSLQNHMKMMYGNGFIEFVDIQDARFYFGEHGFKSKVENTLRKLNIHISSVDHDLK